MLILWTYLAVGVVVGAIFFRPIVQSFVKDFVYDKSDKSDYAAAAVFGLVFTIFAGAVWPLVLAARAVYLLIRPDSADDPAEAPGSRHREPR